MRRRWIVSALLVVAAAAWVLYTDDDRSTTQAMAPISKTAPPPPGPLFAPLTAISDASTFTTAAQPLAPRFDTSNLFAEFQAAQGSPDLVVVHRGIRAWEACKGFAIYPDVDSWIAAAMPEGLSRQEHDRRAARARASVQRCAGFMGQRPYEQAQALRARAREVGSPGQLLHGAIFTEKRNDERVAERSCQVIRQGLSDSTSVRLISIGLRNAALVRPDHVLNATPQRARTIAINLAMCDLDPDGCSAHSDFVGSACMQKGECDIDREEVYWQIFLPAAEMVDAQQLRQQLVAQVRAGNCAALFQLK